MSAMNVLQSTHKRKDGTKIACKAIKFEISKFELEYTTQYLLQEGKNVSKSSIVKTMERNLWLSGSGAFDGLVDDNLITEDAVDICRIIFPSFY